MRWYYWSMKNNSHQTIAIELRLIFYLNLKEALDFITLVQPEKTYLTHISYTFGFHEAIQEKLPANVFLAYDNLEITI